MGAIVTMSAPRGGGPDTTRQTYAFACLRCGHAWERDYTLTRETDPHGRPFLTYRTGGRTVPSPITSPTCVICDSPRVHVVRPDLVAAVDRARGDLRGGP
jgi:hypothetical protein